MTENAAACPVCGKPWEFKSDAPFGIGRIRAVHPVGKCEPPPPVVYEPESQETISRQSNVRSTVKCLGCPTMFEQRRYNHLHCSIKCRSRWAWAKNARRVGCVICDKTFTTTSSVKDTCSTICHRVKRRRYFATWARETYWKRKAVA